MASKICEPVKGGTAYQSDNPSLTIHSTAIEIMPGLCPLLYLWPAEGHFRPISKPEVGSFSFPLRPSLQFVVKYSSMQSCFASEIAACWTRLPLHKRIQARRLGDFGQSASTPRYGPNSECRGALLARNRHVRIPRRVGGLDGETPNASHRLQVQLLQAL